MSNNVVALMAKYPEPGKVKTRLAKSIGEENALKVYVSLLKNITDNCKASAANYTIGAVVTPQDKVSAFKEEFPEYDFYLSQSGNSLGERMHQAFVSIFRSHTAHKIVLIGADIPDIDATVLNNALTELNDSDVVFGPTTDGGYYLIGMKKVHKHLFDNINWGTETVLQSSLDILESINLIYSLLPPLKDIDTVEDLETFPSIKKSIS